MASPGIRAALSAAPLIVAFALGVVACGSSNDTPTTPTGPSTPVQVGGTWDYSLRLTSASGGDCVGADLQNATGLTDSGTIEITQAGGSLTAIIRSDLVGGACSYSGTASADSFVLNLTRCESGAIQAGHVCSNGAIRDIEFVGNPISATVSGSNATGTSVETYNVNLSNTANRVGVLTLNWSFNATRR